MTVTGVVSLCWSCVWRCWSNEFGASDCWCFCFGDQWIRSEWMRMTTEPGIRGSAQLKSGFCSNAVTL
uniref:Putative secreted peptide n=1 Tax=Anopheles braziliensis TaxID=58242 RepID=A0A2M3ZRD9_9DIPT